MQQLSFLVFADFHYKQGMYASTVRDLEAILDRAAAHHVDFVLHAGDFCNDYPGSPEVTSLLLQNPQKLAVYGCYGNHELETADTSMQFVTPRLTNSRVIWGTQNGKICDGSVGHYYFDCKGYRVIVTDANYSCTPQGTWEHNKTGSHCAAVGNSQQNSLGPDQLLWLDVILTDAAAAHLRCIVISHAAFDKRHNASPDADNVRALFDKVNRITPGTVFLAINGHYHTDGCKTEQGVVYLDVNAVRNAWWNSVPHGKYSDREPSFTYIEYDDNGRPLGPGISRPLLSLRQGSRTLFTKEPLSALITVNDDAITVEGVSSAWIDGLAPDTDREEVIPAIRSRVIAVKTGCKP